MPGAELHHQYYYAWLACPVTAAELAESYLANAVFDAHRADPEFGYRMLFDEVSTAGHDVSEWTVWKICALAHEDLARREFTAPVRTSCGSPTITEHLTGEGKFYVCVIKDAWSNRIVGYSIADCMASQPAVDALRSCQHLGGGLSAQTGCADCAVAPAVSADIYRNERGLRRRSRERLFEAGRCRHPASMLARASLLSLLSLAADRKPHGARMSAMRLIVTKHLTSDAYHRLHFISDQISMVLLI